VAAYFANKQMTKKGKTSASGGIKWKHSALEIDFAFLDANIEPHKIQIRLQVGMVWRTFMTQWLPTRMK